MQEKNPSPRAGAKRTHRHRPLKRREMDLRSADKSPFARRRPTLIDMPLLTTNGKLLGSLPEDTIIRPGIGALRSHPSLPGAEFSRAECETAAAIALSAQKGLLLPSVFRDDAYHLHETQALLEDKDFWAAAASCDAGRMLSLALKQVLISARARELAPHNGVPGARLQAAEDVSEALLLAEEFKAWKEDGGRALPSITKMRNLEKRALDSSVYELAMMAVDARAKGEQLTNPNLKISVSGAEVSEAFMEEYKRKRAILDSFMVIEKNLVSKVIGADALDMDGILNFLSMHPGKRDMLLQRGINRQWLSESWKDGLALYKEIYRSIYDKCGLEGPTPAEKREAALDPANLSIEQRASVASLFKLDSPEEVSRDHMLAFSIWLRADEEELKYAWERLHPDCPEITSAPASLRRFHGLWFSTPQEERTQIWRYGSSDLFATASLAHKFRYGGRGARFTRDEDRMAAVIFPGLDKASDLKGVSRELAEEQFKTFTSGRIDPLYLSPIYSIMKRPDMDISSLRSAAYREAEFRTLAESIGVGYPAPQAKPLGGMWESRTKEPRGGKPAHNEDSCSSVEVALGGQEAIRLDMVADGMGGHKKGDSYLTDSNGQIASRIAKEVFEICAMAGWISTPEDARRTIMLADMAIVKEQIARKVSDDLSVENDMGCTMSILLQRGEKLWGIHAGDSDWKIIRGGEAVFSSVGHTSQYGYLQNLRKQVHEETKKAWYDLGLDPDFTGDPEDPIRLAFNQQVDDETDIRFKERMLLRQVPHGGVSSALGHAAAYIHINNADSGAEPFTLQDDDIITLCSDGVGVPICDHEFAIFTEKAGGDLAAARNAIVQAAAERVGTHEGTALEHVTECECGARKGKPASDDATLMMRYPSGGLKPPERRKAQKRSSTLKGMAPSQPSGEPPSYEVVIEFPPEEKTSAPSDAGGAPAPEAKKAQNEGSGLMRLLGRGPKRAKPLEKTQRETAGSYPKNPIFNSQTYINGAPLPDDATRYLDLMVRQMEKSEVMQDAARRLGVLPRDLEIMVFHAYCGDLEMAKNPHTSPEGMEMIGTIPMHLITSDAERIIHASYLIYTLKELPLDQKDRDKVFDELQADLSAMQAGADHTARLQMTAFSVQGSGGREKGRKKTGPRGGTA